MIRLLNLQSRAMIQRDIPMRSYDIRAHTVRSVRSHSNEHPHANPRCVCAMPGFSIVCVPHVCVVRVGVCVVCLCVRGYEYIQYAGPPLVAWAEVVVYLFVRSGRGSCVGLNGVPSRGPLVAVGPLPPPLSCLVLIPS